MQTETRIPTPSGGVPSTSTDGGWTTLLPSPRPRPGEAIDVTSHDVGTLAALLRILALADVDPATSPHVRLSLHLATNVATGCVLGLDLARRGDASAGLRALALVGADKSSVARAARCREPWAMACRPTRVLTDHAACWRGAFRDAVAALGAAHVVGPLAQGSHHVAHDVVRSILRPATWDRHEGHRRMAALAVDAATGRPVDMMTMATRLVVRRVCDDHHVRRSPRLGAMSPATAWRRLEA